MTDELPNKHTKFLSSLAKVEDYLAEHPISHNKTVRGRGYSYGYTDLATLLKALRPVLSKNKLVLYQSFDRSEKEPEGTVLVTSLEHLDTGTGIRSTTFIPTREMKPQEQGSYFTYCRRYHIMGLLGIHPAPDDDGAVFSTDKVQEDELIGHEELIELRRVVGDNREEAINLLAKEGYKAAKDIPKKNYYKVKSMLSEMVQTNKGKTKCKSAS